ncbi:kinase-like domain-containing protein [Lactarius vividus]|nr:kinase-like domain-containing protein [Lactarius vividus]
MDGGSKSPRLVHLRDPSQLSPSPSPLRASFLDPGEEEQEPDASTESLYVTPPPSSPLVPVHRPAIAITTTNLEDTIASSSSLPAVASGEAEGVEDGDVSPNEVHSGSNPRYPAWLAAIVLPLAEFIDDAADPRAIFTDLQEIAEGESGSVYAAHAVPSVAQQFQPLTPRSPARTLSQESERVVKEGCEDTASLVAIKRVPIPRGGSPKLTDLRGELELARLLRHANVLRMERLYVDVVEESLWIGMELMDRSLADVLGVLGEEAMDESGPVAVSEKMIARFVWDVLLALSYIRKHHIAHRDVRSDNLLLSRAGVLKLSDFSNAVCSPPGTPKCSDHVGVVYWQAPEIRAGLYDPLKVDVWSLGATTWELAHGDPPFMDVEDTRLIVGHQLPPVREPETLSRSFHDFLHLCSQPVASRPDPDELLNAYFIRTACPRSEIVRLLGQCKAIDEQQLRRQSGDSDS